MAAQTARRGAGRHTAGQPPVAAQGTLGGTHAGVGARPGRYQVQLGDAQYLWILIALELIATGWLRVSFKRHHGG